MNTKKVALLVLTLCLLVSGCNTGKESGTVANSSQQESKEASAVASSEASSEAAIKTIPDGVYNTALGTFGQNKNDTFKLWETVVGNLKNARIDSDSKTFVIEAGFVLDGDSSKTIPYGKYELPFATNFKLEAGTPNGPKHYSTANFNELFTDRSNEESYLGYGFSIWIENGAISRILCWGS